jgi:hypothetical protein
VLDKISDIGILSLDSVDMTILKKESKQ